MNKIRKVFSIVLVVLLDRLLLLKERRREEELVIQVLRHMHVHRYRCDWLVAPSVFAACLASINDNATELLS